MHFGAARSQPAGEAVREVGAFATRSKALLDAIDQTVDSLVSNTELLQLLTGQAHRLIDKLRSREWEADLDPDGTIANQLRLGAEQLQARYDRALAGREAARRDPVLREDDGVVDAYTQFIAALADYHNALEDMRETVGMLDALRSPRSETAYTSADDLFAAILRS